MYLEAIKFIRKMQIIFFFKTPRLNIFSSCVDQFRQNNKYIKLKINSYVNKQTLIQCLRYKRERTANFFYCD